MALCGRLSGGPITMFQEGPQASGHCSAVVVKSTVFHPFLPEEGSGDFSPEPSSGRKGRKTESGRFLPLWRVFLVSLGIRSIFESLPCNFTGIPYLVC